MTVQNTWVQKIEKLPWAALVFRWLAFAESDSLAELKAPKVQFCNITLNAALVHYQKERTEPSVNLIEHSCLSIQVARHAIDIAGLSHLLPIMVPKAGLTKSRWDKILVMCTATLPESLDKKFAAAHISGKQTDIVL